MTTTTNLIEKLRDVAWSDEAHSNYFYDEAADLLEAQAKHIEEKETLANAWFDAYERKRIELEEKTKQIEALKSQLDDYTLMMTAKVEALQADAERYRVGREAAFAGLLVDFPNTKTWSDAMDFAYDQMIAARKGNV